MSSETLDSRRRKRIIEHIISGFNNARDAKTFGSMVYRRIEREVGKQRYNQSIAAPDTVVAITEDWTGPTILKTTYLDLKDQHVAMFVVEGMRSALREHNKLKLEKEIVREKPQPQFIDATYIPKTTTMGNF